TVVESRCFASAVEGRSMSRPRRHTSRSCGGSGAGSTSPNMPSRAHTSPTRPRRNKWETAEITERAGSQPPPGMQRNHAARQYTEAYPSEPGRRDHFRKGLGFRKAPDRFDQISVRLGIARDRPAERRDDVERIEIVDRIESGHIDAGKLEAEEAAGRPQHPKELRERDIDPRHIAHAECNGAGIEVAARERQAFGIARHEAHAAVEPALRGALASNGEHFLVDIADRNLGTAAPRLRDAERDIASAAGHVQCR